MAGSYIGDGEDHLRYGGRGPEQPDRQRRDPTKERIFIRADQQTRYGDFMHAMNSLQDAGFYSASRSSAKTKSTQ
jgi:biopolymer transport protein ExbD